MLHEFFTFLAAPVVTVPFFIVTTTLSIISMYDNAILVRSGGDVEKAQKLYKKTALYVVVPIALISVAIATTAYAKQRDWDMFFVAAVLLLFIGLSMSVYVLAYVTRPVFKMVPLADWISIKIFSRICRGEDMAVIFGRALLTIAPFVTIMLTALRFYGPNPS